MKRFPLEEKKRSNTKDYKTEDSRKLSKSRYKVASVLHPFHSSSKPNSHPDFCEVLTTMVTTMAWLDLGIGKTHPKAAWEGSRPWSAHGSFGSRNWQNVLRRPKGYRNYAPRSRYHQAALTRPKQGRKAAKIKHGDHRLASWEVLSEPANRPKTDETTPKDCRNRARQSSPETWR